jgi:hypothetical protein
MHGFPNRTSESIVIRSRSESWAVGMLCPLEQLYTGVGPIDEKAKEGERSANGPLTGRYGPAAPATELLPKLASEGSQDLAKRLADAVSRVPNFLETRKV